MYRATVLLFILALKWGASTDSKISVDVNTGRFVDADGRERFFHGVNSVMKRFPWYDAAVVLNETVLRLYESAGFNVVRLGAMWSGVMPTPDGGFNETYVRTLQVIVSRLAARGMYTLLDMHQDVISSKFGFYDGVPRWLVDKLRDSPHRFPWPFPRRPAAWTDAYLSQAVGQAFQQLYSNHSAALDYWSSFWSKMATTFRHDNAVLGYELINEPWAGDIYTHQELIFPGIAARQNLLPVYDTLVKAIRRHDNRTIVFYEPVTWGVFVGGAGALGAGFPRLPGATDAARATSALSYHYYCWLLTPRHAHHDYPRWQQRFCDEGQLPLVLAAIARDVARTGGGRMLTEFGYCAPDRRATSVNTLECAAVLAHADAAAESWTYWDAHFFDRHGAVRGPTVRAFARAYPRAVSGRTIDYHYNVTTRQFRLRYRSHGAGEHCGEKRRLPTEIFLPMAYHYPHGVRVSVRPHKTSFVRNSVLYVLDRAHSATTETISVRITPR